MVRFRNGTGVGDHARVRDADQPIVLFLVHHDHSTGLTVGVWYMITGHALIIWPMKIIKVHMQNNEPGALIVLVNCGCSLH